MDKLDKNCDQVGQNYDQFGQKIVRVVQYTREESIRLG